MGGAKGKQVCVYLVTLCISSDSDSRIIARMAPGTGFDSEEPGAGGIVKLEVKASGTEVFRGSH
jgi:hypothetical protein